MVGPDIERGSILPTYVVVDTSSTMAGTTIYQLNRSLVDLHDSVLVASMASARMRFSILGFDEATTCYLEMSDLRDIEQMPKLTARGASSLAAVFRS